MQKQEVWLRGPLPGVPPLLQPAAHALYQALEEISELENDYPDQLLWQRPAGVASVGFHLQHLTGVLDRLLTYAREESLDENQLQYLKSEGTEPFTGCRFSDLLRAFQLQVDKAINQFKETDETTLSHVRYVGRARIASTHLGLLFHAAEHTQRHSGQLLVTSWILKASVE
ncbi:DinB family protein [Dyadobacter psychrotolerans]|uniref:DinB family protein n=1 Tax=Dyadobacter psychrotolerans TaxID=2541721 RepID=A0A4R5DUF3_9BACT|nr:DinB family protein [Dyadobacter psychrotolerans]TDE17407.1 DinB family protein [Dyadobacter psychrotolerans]